MDFWDGAGRWNCRVVDITIPKNLTILLATAEKKKWVFIIGRSKKDPKFLVHIIPIYYHIIDIFQKITFMII